MTAASARPVTCQSCGAHASPGPTPTPPVCGCGASLPWIVDATDASLPTDLECGTPVLIDFWAPWCGPCLMMKPHVEAMAGQFAGRLKVIMVNADTCFGSVQAFRVSSYPTLVLGRDRRRADTIVGALAPQQLAQRIATLVG